jgi:hypothetical protein
MTFFPWVFLGIVGGGFLIALAARCGLPWSENPYRAESER